MNDEISLPEVPRFSPQQIQECQRIGDFRLMLFEWYSFTCQLCSVFASLRLESPAFRELPEIQFAVCTGLLNRCSKLMLANMALSHEGMKGESTAIIDRAILESAIKLSWLCSGKHADVFERYLADGLKKELEFKSAINKAIHARGGQVLNIEKRMLDSIQKQLRQSTMTEERVAAALRLPDLASMMFDLGLDRLQYVAWQKLGSHHVHGTWPSLVLHYLKETEDGRWQVNGAPCPIHQNQYFHIAMMVLEAMRSFGRFVVSNPEECHRLLTVVDATAAEIVKIIEVADGNDFEISP
jgi:hypothetical protein